MTNPEIVADYFDKLEKVLIEHDLLDKPELIFNVDETGINCDINGQKVIASMGKRHIYNLSYSDRGTNTTVVASCSAAGRQGPSLVIFRGKRFDEKWKEVLPANTEISVSERGWINNELFLHWFR